MLRLVKDLRNHPAEVFLNFGLPVTLSPDDPIIYGYQGVSYDYYMAYVAWDSLSLASLKKLVLNSISFSSLSSEEKVKEIARGRGVPPELIDRYSSNVYERLRKIKLIKVNKCLNP
ncbi:MAG: hypothetical protein ACK416_01570 [Zestosphaera sp.]